MLNVITDRISGMRFCFCYLLVSSSGTVSPPPPLSPLLFLLFFFGAVEVDVKDVCGGGGIVKRQLAGIERRRRRRRRRRNRRRRRRRRDTTKVKRWMRENRCDCYSRCCTILTNPPFQLNNWLERLQLKPNSNGTATWPLFNQFE